jgi:hypothetical protein
MPADRPQLAQQLSDLSRRVDEIEEFLRRTNEVVEQGLLGDLILEGLRPEDLADIIRTVFREELGRVIPH